MIKRILKRWRSNKTQKELGIIAYKIFKKTLRKYSMKIEANEHSVRIKNDSVILACHLERGGMEFYVKSMKTNEVYIFEELLSFLRPDVLIEKKTSNQRSVKQYAHDKISDFHAYVTEYFTDALAGDFSWEEKYLPVHKEKNKLYAFAMKNLSPYHSIRTLINRNDKNWLDEMRKYIKDNNIDLE